MEKFNTTSSSFSIFFHVKNKYENDGDNFQITNNL